MSDWRTLEGKNIENIYDAIREEARRADQSGGVLYAYVGTDGQNIGRRYTSFVQCVALHIFDDTAMGKGGRVFYIRHLERRYHDRNKRLLREAEITLNLIEKVVPLLIELGVDWEPHVDVNSIYGPNKENKSHQVYESIRGWYHGMGYTNVKFKPDAFVASIVADRHTRGERRWRKKVKKGDKA